MVIIVVPLCNPSPIELLKMPLYTFIDLQKFKFCFSLSAPSLEKQMEQCQYIILHVPQRNFFFPCIMLIICK